MSLANDRRVVQSGTATSYDLILFALPVPLLLGVLVASVLGVPTSLGVSLGGLPSLLLLGVALFVLAPGDPDRVTPDQLTPDRRR